MQTEILSQGTTALSQKGLRFPVERHIATTHDAGSLACNLPSGDSNSAEGGVTSGFFI
jgi:hypothetical protein